MQFKLFRKYKCTFSSFLAVLLAPVGLVVSAVPSSLFVYQHSHCWRTKQEAVLMKVPDRAPWLIVDFGIWWFFPERAPEHLDGCYKICYVCMKSCLAKTQKQGAGDNGHMESSFPRGVTRECMDMVAVALVSCARIMQCLRTEWGRYRVGTVWPSWRYSCIGSSISTRVRAKGPAGILKQQRGSWICYASDTEQHTCLPAVSESIRSVGLQASSVSLTQELLESLGIIIDSLFLQSQSPMSTILKSHISHIQVTESWKRIEFTRVFVCFKNYRVNASGQVLIFKPNLEMLRPISGWHWSATLIVHRTVLHWVQGWVSNCPTIPAWSLWLESQWESNGVVVAAWSISSYMCLSVWSGIKIWHPLVLVWFYRQVFLTSHFINVLSSCITPFKLCSVQRHKREPQELSIEISFSAMAAPVHTSARHLLKGNGTFLYSHQECTVPLSHEPDNRSHRRTCFQ